MLEPMTIHDIINKVAHMNPYKVPGDRESYSQYREGWQDALGQLEAEVEEAGIIEKEEKKPFDFEGFLRDSGVEEEVIRKITKNP